MLKLMNEDLELFLVLSWIIWNQRNTIVHEGALQDPNRLVQRAVDLLEEYREAQVQLTISSQTEIVQTWTPPAGLLYKINFNAAVFADIKASGFRVVIWNDKGEVMAALLAKGPPVMDNEEAKVLVWHKALEFALDAGFIEVVLEGDNIGVMRSIQSNDVNNSGLGHIYGDIHCLAAGFRAWSISYVKRTANSVAHSLAKYARQVVDERVWLEESPPPALEALYFDFCYFNE